MRIAQGLRLNCGKRGLSMSTGVRCARVRTMAARLGLASGRPQRECRLRRLRGLCLATALITTAGACASERTAPTAPTIPTTAASNMLTGHVVATNGGEPLVGVSVTLSGRTAITDAAGSFTLDGIPTGTQRVLLAGSAIVPRALTIAATAGRDVAIDAIQTAGFDLAFYRQMVRNGFEAPPGALQPIRRWTEHPQLYLRTVDETGATVDAGTLDMAERTIRETTPVWTGGRFGIAAVERGTAPRVGATGWITVNWVSALEPGVCGRSTVSGNAIELRTNAACHCGNTLASVTLVRHELGHALGYWHTDAPTDVMTGRRYLSCDQQPSARERAAAAVAYARPVGNTDEDVDPSSTVTLMPTRFIP